MKLVVLYSLLVNLLNVLRALPSIYHLQSLLSGYREVVFQSVIKFGLVFKEVFWCGWFFLFSKIFQIFIFIDLTRCLQNWDFWDVLLFFVVCMFGGGNL